MLRFLKCAAALAALLASSLALGEEPAAPPVATAATESAAPSPVLPASPLELRSDRPEALEGAPDDSPGLLGTLLRMLFGLGFIVALIFVTLNYGLKRVFHIDPSRPVVVRVHERVPLEPKKTVYVVEVGDEYLLLGVGEKEISFLTRLNRDATLAALAKKEGSEKPGKPFWARLASGGRPPAAVPSPPTVAHESSAATRDDAQEA